MKIFRWLTRAAPKTDAERDFLQREEQILAFERAAIARKFFVETEDGQRLLGWFIEQNWILTSAWDRDPDTRLYREARRSFVTDLLDMCRVGPKELARMSAYLDTKELDNE